VPQAIGSLFRAEVSPMTLGNMRSLAARSVDVTGNAGGYPTGVRSTSRWVLISGPN
jgi:hypothetical protein